MSKTLNSPVAALQIIWIGVLLITMSPFTYVSTQPTVDNDEAIVSQELWKIWCARWEPASRHLANQVPMQLSFIFLSSVFFVNLTFFSFWLFILCVFALMFVLCNKTFIILFKLHVCYVRRINRGRAGDQREVDGSENLLESRQQPNDSTSTLCECKVHLLFTRESLASYSAYSL